MLTEANIEQIVAAVTDHVAALAESLSQCFDTPWTLTPGVVGTWNEAIRSDEFQGPGLVAIFDVGGMGVAVLVPELLPLPPWYASPNESQSARLNTLAMEWSMNLFPPELEPARFATVRETQLWNYVEDATPLDWAATMALHVTEADGQRAGSLLLVWPLEKPRFETKPLPPFEPFDMGAHDYGFGSDQTFPDQEPVVETDPFARLRSLPVTVSVRLAEKKITVAQLLGISSGALISFPKSCEAMLDLYVNNARYCRGEAVKIGENFGLKVNEVGTTEERAPKILNG